MPTKQINGTSWDILKKNDRNDMYADEIKALLQQFPQISRHLKHICAIDKIPENLSELDVIVANTE